MDYTDLPDLDPNTALAMYAKERASSLQMLQQHLQERKKAHGESLMLACIDTSDLPEDTRLQIEEREARLHDYCTLVRCTTVPRLIAIIRRIDQILYESVNSTARH